MPPAPADPNVVHPMPEQPRVVLLKPLVTSPLIEVGEFSCYDDPDDPTAVETRNVLYHYGPENSDADIARPLALAWWDWPLKDITEHLRTIMSGSVDDLENAAARARGNRTSAATNPRYQGPSHEPDPGRPAR
ncbi:hypothetical protein ACIRU5_23800 [Streptomyces misionensis]|uniref:hypothetical protein n=1 Tax=Streptomyces misionensis TaxID=67331 RepID=UPI00382ECBBB